MPGPVISLGEFLALGCALLWALNGLVLRTQITRISPAAMNCLRCSIAGLLFWLLLPFDEPLAGLLAVPARDWLLLLCSLVTAIVIGDTLYLMALKEIGLSRSMPLSATYPLTTLAFEYLLFGRPVTADLAAGVVLVVFGIICLSTQEHGNEPDGHASVGRLRLGVLLAISASVLWGLGTAILKPAITNLTVVQTNAIRMPVVAGLLYITRVRPSGERLRHIDTRTLVIVGATGILGMGLGSYWFLAAIKAIGAARTVTLTSVCPVFGLIMAVLFLKERVTLRVLVGAASCLAGVWLVL